MKKLLLSQKIILGIIAIALVTAFLGYGFYQGIKTSDYSKKVKAIMEESNEIWTQQKLEQTNLTRDELFSQVEIIKKDSEAQLDKLSKMKATRKAKNLESKTKEYFTIAQELSVNASGVLNYMKILEESNENLKNMGGTTNTPEEFITMFTDVHKKFSATLTKMKEADVPADFKDFNDEYIKTLDSVDKTIVKALDMAKANQFDQLNTLMPEFDSAMKSLNEISPPNDSKTLEAILTDEKKAKLKSYPDEIKAEADKQAKTLFSL